MSHYDLVMDLQEDERPPRLMQISKPDDKQPPDLVKEADRRSVPLITGNTKNQDVASEDGKQKTQTNKPSMELKDNNTLKDDPHSSLHKDNDKQHSNQDKDKTSTGTRPKTKTIATEPPRSTYDTLSPAYTKEYEEEVWIMMDDYENNDIYLRKNAKVLVIDKSNRTMWTVEDETQDKRADVPVELLMKPDSLYENAWFHGFIDRGEAEKSLADCGKNGAFLVRAKLKADTGKRSFVLSLQIKEEEGKYKFCHYQIKNPSKGNEEFYFINRRIEFPSLEKLICHYSDHADGLITALKVPAPKALDEPISGYMQINDIQKVLRPLQRPPRKESSDYEDVDMSVKSETLLRIAKTDVKRKTAMSHRDDVITFFIDEKRITMEDHIGCGNFGDVYKGKLHVETQKPLDVALKFLKAGEETHGVEFDKEINVMKGIECHPHLVLFYGFSPMLHCIVTEFMPRGDLAKYLPAKKPKLGKRVNMAYQVADGMSYLESKVVIHRDLAARNVLVGDKENIKITDFGLARQVESQYQMSTKTEVPVKWTAPEAIKTKTFTTKSDVWSFGALLVEIFTFAEEPYSFIKTTDEYLLRIIEERLPDHPIPGDCPADIYEDIFMKCLRMDPKRRPTFGEFIKPYLKQSLSKYTRKIFGIEFGI